MGRYGGQASIKVKVVRRERERSKRLSDDKTLNFSCTRTLMHLIPTQFSTSHTKLLAFLFITFLRPFALDAHMVFGFSSLCFIFYFLFILIIYNNIHINYTYIIVVLTISYFVTYFICIFLKS